MTDTLLPPTNDRPATSVEVAVFSLRDNDLQVWLTRRAAPPQRGKWMLPGAFLLPDEALDDAARHLLPAEAEARDAYLEQLYTFGAPKRDPRGRVISVAYFALVTDDVVPRATAGEFAWHSVYALPDLVFDHADILKYALQRLRYKLEYTSVGFELLPNEFTLTELQTAYETVLGEKLDKRNFRRRIIEAEVLAETNRYRENDSQGRPARLYRYRKNAVTVVKARRLFP
jgi:8-oxo-dGTP diphosphatase